MERMANRRGTPNAPPPQALTRDRSYGGGSNHEGRAVNNYAAASIVQREEAVYLAHVWWYTDADEDRTKGSHGEWNAYSTLEAAKAFCENQIGRSPLPWNESKRGGNQSRWDVEVGSR